MKNGLQFDIKAGDAVQKGEKNHFTLQIKNHYLLPIVQMRCTLNIYNRLTGQMKKEFVHLAISAKSTEEVELSLVSEHCGSIQVEVAEVVCTDFFGLFSVKFMPKSEADLLVLPNTFFSNIVLSNPSVNIPEATFASQSQKGFNQDEVSGIREYAPGDSMKQIHWKLSSRLNDLFVKEYRASVNQDYVLLLDTNFSKEDVPAEMKDAMMEAFLSVSKTLVQRAHTHKIAWYVHEDEQIQLEDVVSLDDLTSLLKNVLQIEMKESKKATIDYYLAQSNASQAHINIIYITSEYAVHGDIGKYLNAVTPLVCTVDGQSQQMEDQNGIQFSPKEIAEALGQLYV